MSGPNDTIPDPRGRDAKTEPTPRATKKRVDTDPSWPPGEGSAGASRDAQSGEADSLLDGFGGRAPVYAKRTASSDGRDAAKYDADAVPAKSAEPADTDPSSAVIVARSVTEEIPDDRARQEASREQSSGNGGDGGDRGDGDAGPTGTSATDGENADAQSAHASERAARLEPTVHRPRGGTMARWVVVALAVAIVSVVALVGALASSPSERDEPRGVASTARAHSTASGSSASAVAAAPSGSRVAPSHSAAASTESVAASSAPPVVKTRTHHAPFLPTARPPQTKASASLPAAPSSATAPAATASTPRPAKPAGGIWRQ